MKILHIVLSSGADFTDGLGYQENTLPVRHAELGHEVSLITSTTSSLSDEKKQNSEGVYYINSVKIIRLKPSICISKNRFEIFNSLYTAIEKEKPELIFSHGFTYLSLSQVKKYKKRHPEVVVFFDCHATYENSFNRYPKLQKMISKIIWRPLFKHNKDIFSKGYYIAKQVKTFYCDIYDMRGIELTHLPLGNKVDVSMIENRDYIKDDWRKKNNIRTEKVIITGGRFRESKKLYELLRAIPLIKDDSFTLCVFGRFESSEYEIKCKELMKERRIQYLGWLNNDETTEAFLSADIGVFSGSQSVIWRTAIATGLPVVCRYSDGAEELDQGGNCILLKSDDSNEWADTITQLLYDDEKLDEMRNAALTVGRDFFSEDRIAQSIITDYEKFSNKNISVQ